MARSINDNPSFRAANSYRDFDMSQHLCFTSSVGQLLPVYYDVLNPGDKIRASVLMKSRTKPLKSPAFTKITEYCEWYFVPIQQLYKEFGSWFYGVQDYSTSLIGGAAGGSPSVDVSMSIKFPYFPSTMLSTLFSAQAGFDNMMGENWRASSARLFDCLGIPSRVLIDEISKLWNSSDVYWSFAPYLFAAYQKIFMDYYRVDNRIANDPDCYNLDQFAFGFPEFGDNYAIPRGMFELRYRPLRKDFFTNVFPSPIFGENQVGATSFGGVGNVDSVLLRVNQWLTDLDRVRTLKYPGSGGIVGGSDSTAVVLNQPDGASIMTNQMNKASIETLYAVDKLLEVTRRAGKHYDAQTLAHFGVDVPNYIEGKAVRIGKYMEDFIIGDVVATSNTQSGENGSPLGELAGKGYSAGKSKPVEFTAPCHGILMCIYSAAPSVDYYQEGMDRLNAMIEREDWFTPEYDCLGMQPLFGYQCQLTNDNLARNNELRGWQYRYSELKQKYNRIIAGFKGSTKFWTVGRESSGVAGNSPIAYYHSPFALNTIMEFNYLGGYPSSGSSDPATSNDVFDRDPLDHDFYFDVTKVSKMSRYGLMDLN